MSANVQPMLPFTAQRVQRRRDSKRAQIEAFFGDNLGQKFTSEFLHSRFGSAVRTRISEINRDEFSSIRIVNHTDENDHSTYKAEAR